MKNKKIKIIGIILIVFGIFLAFLLLIGDAVKDTSAPTSTDVLPLEEIAKEEGRDIDDFAPAPTGIPPLEGIINEEDGNFEQNNQNPKPLVEQEAPEPTNVPPLDE